MVQPLKKPSSTLLVVDGNTSSLAEGTACQKTQLEAQIEQRLGLVPNCSRSVTETTEITEKEIERPTTLLAAIVDFSDDAIVSKTLEGVITSWNKGAERLFGYAAEEAIGQNITLIIPPDRRSEETSILERLKRGERINHFETLRVRKDGTKLDISLTISPLRDAEGRIVGASKVARDITERKRAERELAKQAGLLDLSNDAIVVRDMTDRVTYWNKGAWGLYGYTREEAAGRVTHELLRTEFPKPLECIEEELRRENRWTGELIHTCKDGRRIVVVSRWVVDQDSQGNPQSILEANNDITEEKRKEKALRESEERLRTLADSLETQVRIRTQQLEQRNADVLEQTEQLRALSKRLLKAQDEERRRIARDLHDSTGQLLALLNMNLSSLKKRSSPEDSQGKQLLEDCASLASEVTSQLRTVSYLLHPPLLDEIGLAAALNWFVEGFEQRSHISVTVEVSNNLRRLPQDLEIALFRIVQEALANIHRHSGSKRAAIRISRDEQNLFMEIEDNGKGIPSDRLAQVQAHGSGVGIAGMRERIRPYGGTLDIESSDKGTRISVICPLQS